MLLVEFEGGALVFRWIKGQYLSIRFNNSFAQQVSEWRAYSVERYPQDRSLLFGKGHSTENSNLIFLNS